MVFTLGRLNHLIVALKRVQGLILKHSGLSTRNWAFLAHLSRQAHKVSL